MTSALSHLWAAVSELGDMNMARQLYTVPQFAERHAIFSEAALRNLIFKAEPRESSKGTIPGNGLASAIVRVGRKVLIDEAAFFSWIDSRGAEREGSDE